MSIAESHMPAAVGRGPRTMIRFGVPVLALAGIATAVVLARPSPPPRDQVIARVDGVPILRSDATTRIEGLGSVHGKITSLGKDWRHKVLQSLVDDVIMRREADRIGVFVASGDVAKVEARVRGGRTQVAFTRWLSQNHMDEPELQRRITLQLLTARVYGKVTAGVKVTDAEIAAYYRRHRSEFVAADGEPTPLLDVRTDIEETLTKDKKDRAFATWLEGRRRVAHVVVAAADWR